MFSIVWWMGITAIMACPIFCPQGHQTAFPFVQELQHLGHSQFSSILLVATQISGDHQHWGKANTPYKTWVYMIESIKRRRMLIEMIPQMAQTILQLQFKGFLITLRLRMSLVPVVRKIAYLPHNYIQLLFWPGGSMAQHIVTNPYPSSFAWIFEVQR